MSHKEKFRKKTKFKDEEAEGNQRIKPKKKRPKNKYRHFKKWLDDTESME